jgi:hypothetical protein
MQTTFTITSDELTNSETEFLMAWLQKPKGSRPTKGIKTKRLLRPSTEEVQYITDQILKGRSNSQIAADVNVRHGADTIRRIRQGRVYVDITGFTPIEQRQNHLVNDSQYFNRMTDGSKDHNAVIYMSNERARKLHIKEARIARINKNK